MLGTLLLGGVVGLVVAILASYIALKLYGSHLRNSIIQQEGWEHAQEARQQQWQEQQEKRFLVLEQTIADNLRQVQRKWQQWEEQDIQRKQELEHRYEMVTQHAALEHRLNHLLLVEEASLPPTEHTHRQASQANILPAQLQGADLSGRDFSRRYLAGANLRGATLVDANLFMADLSGACLAGADLSGADLSGANLMHADLREATLIGANVLVADLNDAILLGAKLQKIRNLTTEQIITTIHDSTTQFDEEKDITLPRVPSTSKYTLPPSSTPVPSASTYDIIRAQSLNAIPATPVTKLEEQTPIPDTFEDTAFVEADSTEHTPTPSWMPAPSNETLRLLEELHLSAQQGRRTDTFGTPTSQDELNGRSQVHAV